jgi:hypothetical protein
MTVRDTMVILPGMRLQKSTIDDVTLTRSVTWGLVGVDVIQLVLHYW